ncbi:hypothetical protein DAI22_11g129250 [Oryza sativa Japonica Group]|nr:hypothetical protein DAI22_11g129250 [Oryza sativa Japonica Group]
MCAIGSSDTTTISLSKEFFILVQQHSGFLIKPSVINETFATQRIQPNKRKTNPITWLPADDLDGDAALVGGDPWWPMHHRG